MPDITHSLYASEQHISSIETPWVQKFVKRPCISKNTNKFPYLFLIKPLYQL
jgi:hypothetical protein